MRPPLSRAAPSSAAPAQPRSSPHQTGAPGELQQHKGQLPCRNVLRLCVPSAAPPMLRRPLVELTSTRAAPDLPRRPPAPPHPAARADWRPKDRLSTLCVRGERGLAAGVRTYASEGGDFFDPRPEANFWWPAFDVERSDALR
ncbi:hypothetical protein AB1Y20_005259 [Prymnesium parvum]|uniref:Uncharacterized protein n=1 Tax=Prymnesium parvum TaxID=97485 RepID=A0AB34J3A3_PRYPA